MSFEDSELNIYHLHMFCYDAAGGEAGDHLKSAWMKVGLCPPAW